jgi:2-polyprenyl-6-methoxyphenol hydroxylase-like FAD-dependent oxidoreductase
MPGTRISALEHREVALAAGTHAVVIGAGIAGLCAARVLADTHDHVTVLDRDMLAAGDRPRPGAPQGRHVHALLVRGNLAIRELFPGLVEDLVAEGVPVGDLLAHTRAYVGRYRILPVPSGLEGVYISRPHLEARLRGRLTGLPGVTVRSGRTAVGLTVSPDGTAVTGVRTVDGAGRESEVHGDLVVDASGRGSRAAQWLTDIGYRPAPEQRVRIDIAYSSCTFSMPADVVDHAHGVLINATPGNPRGGGLIDMGGDRWLVSLSGYRDTHPPVTLDGFIEFASRLAVPDIHDALCRATATGTPVRYRMPEAVRRRYDRLEHFPDRLVVVGDAASAFNPVYGQGMSVAAQEALVLGRHLRAHGHRQIPRLRSQIARSSAAAWTMSVDYDLRMPWVPGRRTPAVRLGNAYLALLHRAATRDPEVARAFMRVANLIDGPAGIARPSIALRVLAGGLLRHAPSEPARAPGTATP